MQEVGNWDFHMLWETQLRVCTIYILSGSFFPSKRDKWTRSLLKSKSIQNEISLKGNKTVIGQILFSFSPISFCQEAERLKKRAKLGCHGEVGLNIGEGGGKNPHYISYIHRRTSFACIERGGEWRSMTPEFLGKIVSFRDNEMALHPLRIFYQAT